MLSLRSVDRLERLAARQGVDAGRARAGAAQGLIEAATRREAEGLIGERTAGRAASGRRGASAEPVACDRARRLEPADLSSACRAARATIYALSMETVKRHSRWIGTLIGLVVVGVTFGVVLPRVADYRDVFDVLGTIDPTWIVALVAATAVQHRDVRAAVDGRAAGPAVPPGAGLHPGVDGADVRRAGWWARRHGRLVRAAPLVGLPLADVARAVTLTGIWNQLSNLLLPGRRRSPCSQASPRRTAGLVSVALIGAAIFGVAATGDRARALAGRPRAGDRRSPGALGAIAALGWFRRGPVGWSGESFARFQIETVGLLRRRWHLLTLAAILGNLTVFVVLLVSFAPSGSAPDQLTWIEVFAGWSISRVLGLIPLTPGGLGVVELGLTTALVGFGGAERPGGRRRAPLSICDDRPDALARRRDDARLAPAPPSGEESRAPRGIVPGSEGAEPQAGDVEPGPGDFARLRARGVETRLAARPRP